MKYRNEKIKKKLSKLRIYDNIKHLKRLRGPNSRVVDRIYLLIESIGNFNFWAHFEVAEFLEQSKMIFSRVRGWIRNSSWKAPMRNKVSKAPVNVGGTLGDKGRSNSYSFGWEQFLVPSSDLGTRDCRRTPYNFIREIGALTIWTGYLVVTFHLREGWNLFLSFYRRHLRRERLAVVAVHVGLHQVLISRCAMLIFASIQLRNITKTAISCGIIYFTRAARFRYGLCKTQNINYFSSGYPIPLMILAKSHKKYHYVKK